MRPLGRTLNRIVTLLAARLPVGSKPYDLPKFEEHQIVQEYQGRSYPLQELTERIRQHLRDRGYAKATVELLHAPTAPSNAAPQSAEISVRVSAGPQYKLSRFVVEGANALSMYEIVQQFPLHPGELFSATAVGKGLIQLKQLYRTHGYANFAAIPRLQFDDSHRTVALILEIQEGHAS
jgi:outer membrane protein assembly factor BamA